MTQLVERQLAADGVAADGYAALSLIGARGSVRLTELAEELGMPLTTASDASAASRAAGSSDDARTPPTAAPPCSS